MRIIKHSKSGGKTRQIILTALISFLFAVLITRLAYIQIFSYKKYSRAVTQMVHRENIEQGRRGDILDSSGAALAISLKRYDLYIDPRSIKDYAAVKANLAASGIKLPKNNLKDYGNTSYVRIADNLSEEAVAKIKSGGEIFGIGFETKYIRQYPEGKMLAHILGRVGVDGNGLNGIEQSFNSYLSGGQITIKQYRDGNGNLINEEIIDKTQAEGGDLVLTIDKNIQFIAEQELERGFIKNRAKKAIAIVQRPKTGEILAMVILPEYSLSDKISDVKVLKNSAISDIFEPGSAFKITAVAGAINENKIKVSDKFYLGDGEYKIAGHTIHDDHIIKGYADTAKIMEMSSNIGLIKIASTLGEKKFYEYIRKFGFYSLTGIDLPGESRGLLLETNKWNALSLPNISFGQGIGVTALQLINAFSAIANDGVLMKPIIVKKMDKQRSDYSPKMIRKAVSADTAREIKKLLKNAVENGTGIGAKVRGYSVGGKTGTAQKINANTGQYSKYNYISIFCGILPAEEPEITILVLFDEPKGSYYAASVAAPVFAKIAERTAKYLNLPQTIN
ncbi:MAG: penicillin-binding protein 2 [Elusimicrobiota bacterium]|nr:penicillin-binding protein 2 [Elusimicrobiota bacterium]